MSDSEIPEQDPSAPLRHSIYILLIVLAAVSSIARIFTVESKSHRTPFLSANDRSRWSSVRSLVEHGTFAIDDVIFRPDGKRDGDWSSIDIVRHRGRDGHEHYYSSKPPLLSILLAGEYWCVHKATGATLSEQPFYVGRIMLVLTNIIPFVICLLILTHLIEQLGTTDWGRIFTVAAAAFGTYLTTMNVTLNNHTIAAVSVAVAIYYASKIWMTNSSSLIPYIMAGFFAAMAAANELPALSFAVSIAAALGWKSWKNCVIGFAPAAIIVAIAAIGSNYLAHGSWRPPYAHRDKDGPLVVTLSGDAKQLATYAKACDEADLPAELKQKLQSAAVNITADATVSPRSGGHGWVLFEPSSESRFAIAQRWDAMEVREWDDWYEFDGSYWSSGKQNGVDKGEESRVVYLFHMLVGHHGVFSLSPIWLLAFFGVAVWIGQRAPADQSKMGFAWLVVMLTAVCISFYLSRPLIDRNYGGVSCGFRWLFWLIPLWILCLIPACDRLAHSTIGRWFAIALLAISVFSVGYSGNNPWSHPWLFDYWTTLGWIRY